MQKPIAYFHIDTESTTLDRTTGHLRSIGWIITDGKLNELGRGEVEVLVDPMLWDPSILMAVNDSAGAAVGSRVSRGWLNLDQ